MKRYRNTLASGESFVLRQDELGDTIYESDKWNTDAMRTKIAAMKIGDVLVAGDEKLERLDDAGTALWPFALTVVGGVVAGVILDRVFRNKQ